MSTKILVTGGTFDKEYDEINGSLYFKETHIPEMLRLGRCTVDIEVRTLMMIDSLEMTEDSRKTILDYCQQCEEEKIVITHGTDTMEETAHVLGHADLPKTIILTGVIPYKFGSSDGFFNLGSAIAFAGTLSHGVYIAMNGRYFHWSNVTKNKKTGVFEEIS